MAQDWSSLVHEALLIHEVGLEVSLSEFDLDVELSDNGLYQEITDNRLDAVQQIEHLTERIHQHGTKTKAVTELWDEICQGVRHSRWDNYVDWREKIAETLAISPVALRQREHKLKQLIKALPSENGNGNGRKGKGREEKREVRF